MKKLLLISLLVGALPLSMAAQDDLYFTPKKKTATVENVTKRNGMPKDTYYVGSNRSIDDYNRRVSHYEVIDSDSVASDIILFDEVKGIYPDSLEIEDYALTKKLSRFDDYTADEKSAYWKGYYDGRYDWAWHSPWYYSRYGYGWYDPFFFVTDHFWYDPWYYGWYGFDYYGYYGYYGWYNPWYYGYWGWRYPWNYGYYGYYGGGGGIHRHSGTIHRSSGTMSGRNYGRSSGSSLAGRSGGGNSRLGSTRASSLHNRQVAGHSAYSNNVNYDRNDSGSSFNNSSHATYSGGGGYSGASSAASSARSSGGGGARSGGGHVGGRR